MDMLNINKKCGFCREYNFWKTENKKADKKNHVSHKIFAKMCIYGWRKGQRRVKKDAISVITTRSYDLKYCPTCGRKLKWKMKNI